MRLATIKFEITAIVLALALTSCAGQAKKQGSGKENRRMNSDEEIAIKDNNEYITVGYLNPIFQTQESAYAELTDWKTLPDGERAQHESEMWCGIFLTKQANPYHQENKVKRSAHRATPDTFDMLRHEFTVKGLHCIVIETVDVLLIEAREPGHDLMKLTDAEKRATIDRLGGAVLNTRGVYRAAGSQNRAYHWTFRYGANLTEGAHFSTNPTAAPSAMLSWAERADGGIHEGHAYFLCFKKREPVNGKLIFLNGQHWFDGKCWEATEASRRP